MQSPPPQGSVRSATNPITSPDARRAPPRCTPAIALPDTAVGGLHQISAPSVLQRLPTAANHSIEPSALCVPACV
eukprot:5652525-Prymnesium_polylepis.1